MEWWGYGHVEAAREGPFVGVRKITIQYHVLINVQLLVCVSGEGKKERQKQVMLFHPWEEIRRSVHSSFDTAAARNNGLKYYCIRNLH